MRYLAELEQLERLRSENTPTAPWLPILFIQMGSQVKTTQNQSYNFKENAKKLKIRILQHPVYETHLLELLDTMYKYELDPASIVEDTEQTPFRETSITSPRANGGPRAPPPPMILRECYHFVQGTLRNHISDVTRKKRRLKIWDFQYLGNHFMQNHDLGV